MTTKKNPTTSRTKKTTQNSRKKTNTNDDELMYIRRQLARAFQNSQTLSRTSLASRLGMQFNGERDLYGTFGYPVGLSYENYRTMYDRLGLATRVVEKFSDDTWSKPPVLIDGSARSDSVGDETTPFLEQWNELVKRLQVWQIFRQADIMCGIGKYSVVFLGTAGDYETPAKQGGNIFYISAYDEKQAVIKKYIRDKRSERYGLPEVYGIKVEEPGELNAGIEEPVHYSRCIHISENRLGSRVFGRPRLQEVFNRLMDIEKVTGGGAEAAWLAVYMGFLLLSREGSELPLEDSTEWTKIDETIQRFAHRIQRYAVLTGIDKVENLGVHEVRIKDIYSVLISDLAGSKGIPQRILLGSERGELASSQDMQEWNGVIRTRRTNFAEPEILDPFINQCIALGVVAAPSAGKWSTEWQPVYAPTQLEEAEYAERIARGANQVTNGMPSEAIRINEWRGMVRLPPKETDEDGAGKIPVKKGPGIAVDGDPETALSRGAGNGGNRKNGKKPETEA